LATSPLELGPVDHIGLLVGDIEEAKRFYTQTLGMTIERESQLPELGISAAFFSSRSGGAMIEAIELRSAAREHVVANRAAGLDHLAVRVPDVDAAVATLAEQGVEMTTEVLDLGGRRTAFTRPETSGGVVYQLVPIPAA
jgi:methylmalonyl-CoA/ethylmalonyl-CoA epimerase